MKTLALWISSTTCVVRMCFAGGYWLIWWGSKVSASTSSGDSPWFPCPRPWPLPEVPVLQLSFLIHSPSSESSWYWLGQEMLLLQKDTIQQLYKECLNSGKLSTLCHYVLPEGSLLRSWLLYASFRSFNLKSCKSSPLSVVWICGKILVCTEQRPVFSSAE